MQRRCYRKENSTDLAIVIIYNTILVLNDSVVHNHWFDSLALLLMVALPRKKTENKMNGRNCIHLRNS